MAQPSLLWSLQKPLPLISAAHCLSALLLPILHHLCRWKLEAELRPLRSTSIRSLIPPLSAYTGIAL